MFGGPDIYQDCVNHHEKYEMDQEGYSQVKVPQILFHPSIALRKSSTYFT